MGAMSRVSMPRGQRRTTLSIWAHPDDETYLAGGIMAAGVAGGDRVVCVAATAGERGTDDPARWPPERLGPLRHREHAAAMEALGVSEHRILGLPDGGLDAVGDEAGSALVVSLIEEIRPDRILTFGADGATFHPDHRAISRWVTLAWQRGGCPGQLLHSVTTVEQLSRFGALYEEWGIYMTDERPEPVAERDLALHLRLEGDLLDRKVAALTAMPSQTAAAIEALGVGRFRAVNAEETYVSVAAQPVVWPAGLGRAAAEV
jgi:LmbE family N-acetylglucosaminyl deacetylase